MKTLAARWTNVKWSAFTSPRSASPSLPPPLLADFYLKTSSSLNNYNLSSSYNRFGYLDRYPMGLRKTKATDSKSNKDETKQ